MDMVYWDVYLQIPSLLTLVYAVIGKKTRALRGCCPLQEVHMWQGQGAM